MMCPSSTAQAGFDHLDEVLKLDHAAIAEAAALRARTYLQLALPAARVHFIDSDAGLDRRVLHSRAQDMPMSAWAGSSITA